MERHGRGCTGQNEEAGEWVAGSGSTTVKGRASSSDAGRSEEEYEEAQLMWVV